MVEGKKRLTVGVLVSGITDDITKYVCRGVIQKARAADVNGDISRKILGQGFVRQ